MPKSVELPAELRSLAKDRGPVQINDSGHWLILNDVHLPYSDDATVKAAISEAKRLAVKGILLNGDIIDSGEISRHDKHRDTVQYNEEIALGKKFLEYIRGLFPKSRIVYKLGNHEERFDTYVFQNAAAFRGLDDVRFEKFMHMGDYGVEHVDERRIIRLGKLNVLHGHEFKGGGGVNVARWLYLQCGGGVAACCGHFHRSCEHHERNLTGFNGAAWGIGCACDLHPHWLPQNKWNLGFATVDLAKDGDFHFTNHRVFPGGRLY